MVLKLSNKMATIITHCTKCGKKLTDSIRLTDNAINDTFCEHCKQKLIASLINT